MDSALPPILHQYAPPLHTTNTTSTTPITPQPNPTPVTPDGTEKLNTLYAPLTPPPLHL